MKTIMVDMDDVITIGNFNKFLEEFLGQKIDTDNNKYKYRQEAIKGRENEFRLIYQYRNLYANVPLLDGCYEVLRKLNEKYDVYIVTAYIWGQDIINAEENLKNKFIYLKENLPFISSQKYIFTQDKKILDFDIKIDDRINNLEGAKIKLLFTAWHNKNISSKELESKGIIRVDSWYDIEKVLENINISTKLKEERNFQKKLESDN